MFTVWTLSPPPFPPNEDRFVFSSKASLLIYFLRWRSIKPKKHWNSKISTLRKKLFSSSSTSFIRLEFDLFLEMDTNEQVRSLEQIKFLLNLSEYVRIFSR